MRSYTEHWTWDVFLSYARVDDSPGADELGWVGHLSKELTQALDVLSGQTGRVRVFRDVQLRAAERFSDALDRAVHESAVFVALLSSGFRESAFCHRELGMFLDRTANDGVGATTPAGLQRMVPVTLAQGMETPFRRDMAIARLHELFDATSPGFPLSPSHPDFRTGVQALAQTIFDVLTDLRAVAPGDGRSSSWLSAEARGALTAMLRNPSLGLNDESRRSVLVSRAYAARAPSLHALLQRCSGDIDEWIGRVINAAEDYGIVDVDDAVTVLLDVLPSSAQTTSALTDEARHTVAKCWNKRDPGAAPVVTSPVSTDAGVTLELQDAHRTLTTAWIDEAAAHRRVLALRGRKPDDDTHDLDELCELVALDHPHVLRPQRLIDAGASRWMELAWRPGGLLAEMAPDPLSLRDVADYVEQLADALDVAHCSGIVHGRLAPDCVHVDRKRSFASVLGFEHLLPRSGGGPVRLWTGCHGGEAFMAPEAARGHPAPRSDQYSLALIACAMLLGLDATLADLAGFREQAVRVAPQAVADAIERALAPRPTDRYSTNMQFAGALRWALRTGRLHADERDREHEYLGAMRQECMTALGGYVDLRGHKADSAKATSLPVTGAGRATVRHPVLYRVAPSTSTGKPRIVEDVSRELRADGRVLLLGEPGSGKTTTLLYAAENACREAQRNSAAPIPVIVPLNLCDDSQSLRSFARAQMAHLGDECDRLLSEERVLFFFDALNEAPPRARSELGEFLGELSDFVISCRTRDYERDLADITRVTVITILPLDLPRIRLALERLLGAAGLELWAMLGGSPEVLSRYERMQRHGDGERIWEAGYVPGYTSDAEDEAWAALERSGLMELCQNPFLLRVVSDLFVTEGAVPENRSSTFATSVRTLVRRELDRMSAVEQWAPGDERYALSEARIIDVLTQLASAIQKRQQGAGIDRAAAIEELTGADDGEESVAWAIDLAQDASLLAVTNQRLVFTHQLLQEYFAGAEMRAAFEAGETAERFFPAASWWRPHGWEETAIILAGVLGTDHAEDFTRWLAHAQPALTVRCIREAGLPGWTIGSLGASLRAWLQALWHERYSAEQDRPQARTDVARALAAIGDPRPGVGTALRHDITVPDIDWVPISGSASIARYPITVAQFACLPGADRPLEHADVTLPQTRVTWDDAQRYARWLSEVSGDRVRLQTETEWQSAVRVALGEEWPTSGAVPTVGNIAGPPADDIEGPSPVGVFDDGLRPVGDLLGNAWEWCDVDPAAERTSSPSTACPATHLLKGGSWRRGAAFAHPHYRCWAEPRHTADDVGFRLVRDETEAR